jgi:hypothetical protein
VSGLAGLRNVALYLSEGHVVRLLLTEREAYELRARFPITDLYDSAVIDMDTQAGARIRLQANEIKAMVDEDASRVAERTRLLYEMQEHAS